MIPGWALHVETLQANRGSPHRMCQHMPRCVLLWKALEKTQAEQGKEQKAGVEKEARILHSQTNTQTHSLQRFFHTQSSPPARTRALAPLHEHRWKYTWVLVSTRESF